jgi:Flp pilus assembly protein TadG
MRRSIQRFWSDRKGNIAILFALAVVPVIGAMGAAVDYSMANSYRTSMQKALDATALALSKIMPANQNTLDTVGNQYFQANFGTTTLSNVTLQIVPNTGTIQLTAKGYYTPELANILGLGSFEVGARSEVKWSIGKVEVALALDNTGSMASSGKLTQLKIAAHTLLNTLQQAAANPGDAKVAIVAFGVQVRVPTSNSGASWIRWDLWEAVHGTCSSSQYTTKSSCESHNRTWTPANHNTWTGCIEDRDQSNDVQDTAPTSSNSTKYPAAQECGNLATVMGLNYNWGTDNSNDATTLHGKINQMQAVGNTNVTIGLSWAWHLLSSTSIYTEGAAYGTANLQKYIILLTDGDNTENRWSTNESSINNRTTAACNNIKALKDANNKPYIKIYTIRVINGNANLLRNCATSTDMYYDVDQASELNAVFSSIGSQIANLHLSK